MSEMRDGGVRLLEGVHHVAYVVSDLGLLKSCYHGDHIAEMDTEG